LLLKYRKGCCLSDVPLHDANRELMIMNENWRKEWNLTQELEILNDNLQKAYSELENEKKKTDEYLFKFLFILNQLFIYLIHF
jgi:hypothetical protein